ncbi:5'-nucleotidase C-terminal domain-containing protein [Christiangramia aquimixticola]|uniref:5'-nucleotidase C-terminal domain-containing protein n=1 Tax=Christiangramia aquimixticola TaxID=1697558 RepID=UPI003AA7CDDF
MKKLFIVLLLSLCLNSCKNVSQHLSEVSGERISIDGSIEADKEILEFIEPYKNHLNSTLDSALAYNPRALTKNDGDLNSSLGNLMADALMLQVNPIFKKQTGEEIDMVLLNHGGIRAELPAGNVTTRMVYQIMPFENMVVIAELSGSKMKEMLQYLSRAKTAHPVNGIEIEANSKYIIQSARINGEEIRKDKTYFVATSDYLLTGGDNMKFFENPVSVHNTGYKIRNVLVDYFKAQDTIKSVVDNRYFRN